MQNNNNDKPVYEEGKIFDLIDDNDPIKLEEYLKEYPSSINETFEDNSPIVMAVLDDSNDLVQILIKYGANVNDLDSLENKPILWWAIESNNLELVKILLENNASCAEFGTLKQVPITTCKVELLTRYKEDNTSREINFEIFKLLAIRHESSVLESILHQHEFLKGIKYENILPENYIDALKILQFFTKLTQEGIVQEESKGLINQNAIDELIIPKLKLMVKGNSISENLKNLPQETPQLLSDAINNFLKLERMIDKQLEAKSKANSEIPKGKQEVQEDTDLQDRFKKLDLGNEKSEIPEGKQEIPEGSWQKKEKEKREHSEQENGKSPKRQK